jgi:protein O-mannosyl-transferase
MRNWNETGAGPQARIVSESDSRQEAQSDSMKSVHMERLAAIILIAACLLVFGGVARNGFINFDDGPYVYGNPRVQSGLTLEGLAWAFKTMHSCNWHPLTWISHMLDCEFYGMNPTGHHLTNLFLHIANTLLLFLLLRNATGCLWESFAVASLFAIHPLRVETVAWVSERKDVLSAFFAMLTMLVYVHYVRQPNRSAYFLMLFLFALGLMAKPMLVTLPFVLLLLDFWPLNRLEGAQFSSWGQNPPHSFANGAQSNLSTPQAGLSIGALLLEKIPLFVLSVASCVVTYIAQYYGGAVTSFEVIPLKIRIMNALVACVQYLKKTFWPQNLAVFYPHPGSRLPGWEAIAAGLFLMTVSLLVIRQAARRPFLLTGWFWFLGMLVPVLGIIQVGGQSVADRYTYLPSIGIFVILAWTLPSLLGGAKYSKVLLAGGLALAVVSLSVVTWMQTGYWKDTQTLFRRAAAVTTNNHLAHCLLGDALAAEDKLELAREEYETALAIWSEFPEAHNNLGMVLAKRGLHQEAMSHYEEALRVKPNYASAHVNIANELAERGDLNGAVLHYSKALDIDMESVTALSGLGVVMARMQKMDEAVFHLTKAIELCPKCAEPHNNLGRVLILQGNLEEASRQLQRAIELSPAFAEAYNNMGLLYLQIGALEEALYYVSAALHFREDYAKARTNLRQIAALIAQSEGTDKKDSKNQGSKSSSLEYFHQAPHPLATPH